jgi:hypothetical protein
MFDLIDSQTGFAAGDEFDSAADVRAYFTPDAQVAMFGADAVTDADKLDEWAREVIENAWHMSKEAAADA